MEGEEEDLGQDKFSFGGGYPERENVLPWEWVSKKRKIKRERRDREEGEKEGR